MKKLTKDILPKGPRKEYRYIIDYKYYNQLIKDIKKITTFKKHKNKYNHTIYFNNDDYESPFCTSIKARNYSTQPRFTKKDFNNKWIFELKKYVFLDKKLYQDKQREILTIQEIITKINNKPFSFKKPFKPILANTYERKHFVVDKKTDFRITIDKDLNICYLDNKHIKTIKKEKYIIFEAKVPKIFNKTKKNNLEKILLKYKAIPTISKKDVCHNYLTTYLLKTNKYTLTNKIETEIEAKLTLTKSKQNVFYKIRDDFINNKIKGFTINKKNPHIYKTGKIHKYIFNKNKIYRITSKANKHKVIIKDKGIIVKDNYNLNNILIRTEKKVKFTKKQLLLPNKQIYKKRKYFIVKKNLKEYFISIDWCIYNNKDIYQIEIEAILTKPTVFLKQKAVDDISFITKYIVDKYPFLKPEPVTKLDLLK